MQKHEKPSGDNQANILYKEIFFRNGGLISETEQDILRRSSVAIAGVGGVGGLLAERLVRIGIGRIKITDPGTLRKVISTGSLVHHWLHWTKTKLK